MLWTNNSTAARRIPVSGDGVAIVCNVFSANGTLPCLHAVHYIIARSEGIAAYVNHPSPALGINFSSEPHDRLTASDTSRSNVRAHAAFSLSVRLLWDLNYQQANRPISPLEFSELASVSCLYPSFYINSNYGPTGCKRTPNTP